LKLTLEENVPNIRRFIIALGAFLVSGAVAMAQTGPNINVAGGNATTKVTVKTGPKSSQTATITPGYNGTLSLPAELDGPDKSHSQMREWDCDNGDVYIVPEGDPNPCPGKARKGLLFLWDTRDALTLHPQTGPATSEVHHPGSTSDLVSPSFEVSGGWSNINGNNPALFRFGSNLGFRLGNRLEFGPTVSYQHIGTSGVDPHFGAMTPGSTSFATNLESNEALLGGFFGIQPAAGWEVTVHVGADVDHATVTRILSACGPTACSSSKTTMKDTVTNPFLGFTVSRDFTPYIAVFVGYDHVHEEPSAGTGSSLPNLYEATKDSVHFGFRFHLWSRASRK
jgi:hypothetical protein